MSVISERLEVLQKSLQEAIERNSQAMQVANVEREKAVAINGAILELQALEPPGEDNGEEPVTEAVPVE